MKLIVYSSSSTFTTFLGTHLELPFEHSSRLQEPGVEADTIHLLHMSGMEQESYGWLKRFAGDPSVTAAACSDIPRVGEMLECARLGARGYCNSHMASVHYYQLLQLLENGQSWFPPQMLVETFQLAQQAIQQRPTQRELDGLTQREKEIALAVADGKSNRQIADQLEITEPTVKTHLTNIFKKLELRDRVGLALFVNQA